MVLQLLPISTQQNPEISTYNCFGCVFIGSGSGSSLDWIPIRIQGFDNQIEKKITAEKKIKYFFDQKLQFIYP